MSDRIPAEQIATIKPEHLKWMFGDFREMIHSRIAELSRPNHALSAQNIAFFQYLLSEVDADKFSRIQQSFLSAQSRAENGNMLKYIDPITWFESKLNNARWIGLDSQPPRRILDVGTGPGHFPVVARFFGHDVVGTDLPARSQGLGQQGHLYDALCELYGVARVSNRIYPFEPIGDVGGRYDMVTAFLAAFNIDEETRPWSIDHWRFFLHDLGHEVINKGGVLCMTLDDSKLTPDSWSFLSSIADRYVEKKKQIQISKFDS